MTITYDIFKELATKGLELKYGEKKGGAIAFLFFGKYGLLGLADVASVVTMAQNAANKNIGGELTEDMAAGLLMDVFGDLFILAMNQAGVTIFETLEQPLFFVNILFSSERAGNDELPDELRNWKNREMERPYEEAVPDDRDNQGNQNENTAPGYNQGAENDGNNTGNTNTGQTNTDDTGTNNQKYERDAGDYDKRDPFEEDDKNKNGEGTGEEKTEDAEDGMTMKLTANEDGRTLQNSGKDDQGPEIITVTEKESPEKETNTNTGDNGGNDDDDDDRHVPDKYDNK